MSLNILSSIWGDDLSSEVYDEQVKLLATYINEVAVALLVGVILAIALGSTEGGTRSSTARRYGRYLLVFCFSIFLQHLGQYFLGHFMGRHKSVCTIETTVCPKPADMKSPS
jgi:hypothetical protein